MDSGTGELIDGIPMEEVRRIGETLGILSVNKYEFKADLIRVIQLAEGREPCFNSGGECRRGLCMWGAECTPAHNAGVE